jgi:sulfhydrogenase subunit beta (sulfur reductase)
MAPIAVGDRESLKQLVALLWSRGYEVIGPTVRDGAIVYDRLASVSDLPEGWRDVQEAGRYRLERREDGALFGYVVGPQSWKKFLHPAGVKLFEAQRDNGGMRIVEHRAPPPAVRLYRRACL